MNPEWHASVTVPGTISEEWGQQLLTAFPDRIRAVSIRRDENRVTLAMPVRALSVSQAAVEADRLAREAMLTVDVTDAPVGIQVMSYEDLEREVHKRPIPPLVGVAEIATMLNVTKQRASQIAQRDDFPRPVERLASGAVYVRDHVEAFVKAWPRKAGRPATR